MSPSVLSLSLYRRSLLPLLSILVAALQPLTPPLLHAADIPPVVATVQELPIAAEELTTALRGELIRLDMERYRLLQQKLDELIAARLMRLEASKRGISPQQLEQDEIVAKTTAISADQINAFYEANKQRIRQPLEQIKPRIQDYLQRQEQHKRQQVFLKTLRQRYAVKVALRAPQVDVDADDDPFVGPASAPVTIIEFSDFQCPYCRQVQPTLKRLLQEYEGKIKLVFRDFPLQNIHPLAQKAAEAAQCAADQQQFWPYHDKLFAKERLQLEDLKQFAQELNLELEPFNTCLDAGKYAREVAQDQQDGANAGVSSTPSFFVNGQPINGAASYDHFKELVEAALATAESDKRAN
jgi:protein-disulfide isomerase